MSLRATWRRHVFQDASRPVRAAAEPALQRTGKRAAGHDGTAPLVLYAPLGIVEKRVRANLAADVIDLM